MSQRTGNSSGFTLIELLIVIVILGILAAVAIPKFGEARDRAHLGTIRSDIRNLGAAQERFFQEGMSYSLSIADLDFQPTPGVEVEVTEATAQGWAAVGTHLALDPNRGCAIYLGNAEVPALPNGQAHTAGAGVLQCTN